MKVFKESMNTDRKSLERICEEVEKPVDLEDSKDSDFDDEVLDAGTDVEHEHVFGMSGKKADEVAKMIGKHHIAEFPKRSKTGKVTSDYYKRLKSMEDGLKKGVDGDFSEVLASIRKDGREVDRKSGTKAQSLKDIIDEQLAESMVAGVFGDVGGTAGAFSGDNYAKGDARMPCVLGMGRGKRGRGRNSKRRGKSTIMARTLPVGM